MLSSYTLTPGLLRLNLTGFSNAIGYNFLRAHHTHFPPVFWFNLHNSIKRINLWQKCQIGRLFYLFWLLSPIACSRLTIRSWQQYMVSILTLYFSLRWGSAILKNGKFSSKQGWWDDVHLPNQDRLTPLFSPFVQYYRLFFLHVGQFPKNFPSIKKCVLPFFSPRNSKLSRKSKSKKNKRCWENTSTRTIAMRLKRPRA